MLGNLGGMMKQLREMQAKAEKMQQELREQRFEAAAGGGLVTCVTDGMGQVLEVRVDGAQLGLDEDDAELLQDSITAAIQEAVKQAQEHSQSKVEELTGGLPLPPGLGGLGGLGMQ